MAAKGKWWIAIVIVIVLAVAFWAFRPDVLFYDNPVNETLSAASDQATATPSQKIMQGQFQSVSHHGEGLASIYKLANGDYLLRLSEFKVDNGPDLHVYLVKGSDASSVKAVKEAGFMDLGTLKGNVGDQNYIIPAGTNIDEYKAVSIWCQRFGVNFAAASLSR